MKMQSLEHSVEYLDFYEHFYVYKGLSVHRDCSFDKKSSVRICGHAFINKFVGLAGVFNLSLEED